MSTVIYLSNQEVKALVGTGRRGRATATRTCLAQAPEGSLINGLVTNEEAFTDFLRGFWEENRLAKTGVTLVLGSAQAVTRLIEVPKMSHKKMMEYLPREFAAVERTTNPVYGYVQMGRQGAMCSVLATMVDRSFLEPHMRRFKEMGIRLESVVMATMAEVEALNRMSYLRDKTCIIQVLDGMSMLSILYVEGNYYQFSRSRVFGERGTLAFGVECARIINNQQQFLKTQQVEAEITHVYLGGEFSGEDFEICRDSILQMDVGLEVDKVYEEPGGDIRLQAENGDDGFEKYVAMTGSLLIPKDKSNLLFQYRRNPETIRRRRELMGYLAPAAVTFLILGMFGVGQAFIWFSRVAEVNEQFDYIGNPQVIERVTEYDLLSVQNEALATRAGVIRKTKENLGSYPLYTTAVRQTVEECAVGFAAVDITGFENTTGTVSVEASAGNAENVHRFVNRLEDRTDVFEEIFYDGFDFDERSNTWKTSVKCYLSGPVQAEGEVTP